MDITKNISTIQFHDSLINKTDEVPVDSVKIDGEKLLIPEGYYFPQTSIVCGFNKVNNFEIKTVDYYYDNAMHYEDPKIVEPLVSISVIDLSADTATKSIISTKKVKIHKDSIWFSFSINNIDSIVFQGEFLDKNGCYWNRGISPDAIILRGVIHCNGNDSGANVIRHRFTFTTGD